MADYSMHSDRESYGKYPHQEGYREYQMKQKMKIARISPARSTDPETSHEAAKNTRLGEEQHKVLMTYGNGREMNPYEVMVASEGRIDPLSNYWHRCTDLHRAGYIEYTGIKRPGRTKKDSRVYVITDKGRDYVKGQ